MIEYTMVIKLKDVLIETLLDSFKALPILFLVYILIEFLEHKHAIKFEHIISNKKKTEPLIGSLLGVIPQCGFSAIMADLYSRKIITIGTLFAVFIATSDEALAILITKPDSFKNITILLLVKLISAIVWGYVIDLVFRKKDTITNTIEHHHHHHEEKKDNDCGDCDHNKLHHKHELNHGEECADGILLQAIKHTIQIFIIILISNLCIGTIIHFIGEDSIKSFIENNNYLQYLLAPLVGLIPSCASSVILVELYTTSIISFASCLGGLITGAGVGLIVLYKRNKNIRENIIITSSLYGIGLIMCLTLSIFNL